MTMQAHCMTCTPAQHATYRAIIAWMVTDAEFGEFGREFVVDEKRGTLTASRLAWNALKAASEVWACKNETHPMDAIKRSREVQAMLMDKASAVEVKETVKSGCLF